MSLKTLTREQERTALIINNPNGLGNTLKETSFLNNTQKINFFVFKTGLIKNMPKLISKRQKADLIINNSYKSDFRDV